MDSLNGADNQGECRALLAVTENFELSTDEVVRVIKLSRRCTITAFSPSMFPSQYTQAIKKNKKYRKINEEAQSGERKKKQPCVFSFIGDRGGARGKGMDYGRLSVSLYFSVSYKRAMLMEIDRAVKEFLKCLSRGEYIKMSSKERKEVVFR
jgi:hypothetical protein